MNTLREIAGLSFALSSDYKEPKRIAQESDSDCVHVKKIANQEYPICCDVFRGNQIRNSLINYARMNLGENNA